MTLNTYNALPYEDQLQLLLKKGKYLAGIKDRELHLNLYAIGNFYCEVVYHLEENYILEVKAFTSSNGLSSYLAYITLEAK